MPETEKDNVDVQQWFGTSFLHGKAGMKEVDKDKVKRVVYEMSKVCPFCGCSFDTRFFKGTSYRCNTSYKRRLQVHAR